MKRKFIQAPRSARRSHRRILRITGRDHDMLIIRGVNVYPSQAEAVLVGLPGISLRVEVEANAAMDDNARTAKAAEVQHQIKSIVGVTGEVEVMDFGAVPRSEGKAVRVRDLR